MKPKQKWLKVLNIIDSHLLDWEQSWWASKGGEAGFGSDIEEPEFGRWRTRPRGGVFGDDQ